jgi:hypothetical protein
VGGCASVVGPRISGLALMALDVTVKQGGVIHG